ncbi:immunoglobulin lambda-1 light chain-like [Chanos chanos]|uniref:immunoglobulin lambda-1 light chain-like n=1 Tax=Chanos chanos TaxID=29144 RepID=UPI0011F2F1DE|nr:immunoglobulin lambda-1 light chain-like [Chanos chanos]
MLGTLCTLITALSCVSGVTVVTQKPPVLTVSKGQTVTMDCNLETVTDSAAQWYKQVPGSAPQHVIRFRHSWSSPLYGSGSSSPKFTTKHSSQTDYSLIINNVEVGDSAVYYCQTWDSSANTVVFGQGTKLVVTDSVLPAPVLTLFPPSSEELNSDKVTLVCVANDLSVGFADVSWTVSGTSVTDGVFTSSAEKQSNHKFKVSSYLSLLTSEWESDKEVSCQMSVGSKSSEKKIKKSDCSN